GGGREENREEGRRDRRHGAGEEEAVSRAFQRGQLGLGDLLGGIAVAAILDAVDLALEVVLQLLGVGEGEGGRLHDGRGQRGRGLGTRLAAVHGQRAEAARLPWQLALAHHDTSRRAFSTWRAMARATCLGSAGSSTGLLRCVALIPSSVPM